MCLEVVEASFKPLMMICAGNALMQRQRRAQWTQQTTSSNRSRQQAAPRYLALCSVSASQTLSSKETLSDLIMRRCPYSYDNVYVAAPFSLVNLLLIQSSDRDEEMEQELTSATRSDPMAAYDVDVSEEGAAIQEYLSLLV